VTDLTTGKDQIVPGCALQGGIDVELAAKTIHPLLVQPLTQDKSSGKSPAQAKTSKREKNRGPSKTAGSRMHRN
jgi:hypothetical protein